MHSEKVPYYILDLLQQVPSVYVSGLGRFDAIFHPAVVDIHNSRIKPPHVEPGFEAAGHDVSEILPSYMHYVSGMDKKEAAGSIDEFVERVNHHVNAGETYSIEKFGTFSKSSLDVLHFTPDWDAFNLSFRGLEVMDINLPLTSPPPRHEPPPVDFVPEPIPPIIKDSYEPATENSWVTDQEYPVPESEAETIEKTDIADSTSRLWWTILMGALILITILCAYLVWDIISNRKRLNQYIAITNDSLATTTPDIIIIDTLDTIAEEIPVDSQQISEPEPEPEPVIPKSNEKPCFVVVGAFSNPDNVTRMEARLKELGYAVEQIKGGTLTKVAISTSCDKESLNRTLAEARSGINPEAWIY